MLGVGVMASPVGGSLTAERQTPTLAAPEAEIVRTTNGDLPPSSCAGTAHHRVPLGGRRTAETPPGDRNLGEQRQHPGQSGVQDAGGYDRERQPVEQACGQLEVSPELGEHWAWCFPDQLRYVLG